MTSKESITKMIANSENKRTLARTMGRLTTAVGLAATAGMILSAAGASVRLVGVTRQGDTVLIEATEPVAYSVSRPDPLSLVVDMRNVTVADARADVEHQGAIVGVRLEQTSSADGRALARVHVTLAKPAEYVVRSARNTIRVELKGAGGAVAPVVTTKPAALPMPLARRDLTRGAPSRPFSPADAGDRSTAAGGGSSEERQGYRARPSDGDDHRADQVQQVGQRHDRYARRQRAPCANCRDGEQGSPSPARSRLPERDVDCAGADCHRQPVCDSRARGTQ